MFVTRGGEGPTLEAVRFLQAMRPGTLAILRDLLANLELSADEDAPGRAGGDVTILAGRGAAHLGRAVAAALAVLPRPTVGLDGQDRTVVTAIGAGTGLALLTMTAAPEPDGYREAVLARERAEYVPATRLVGSVQVRNHRLALGEGPVPTDDVDVSATGLAAAVPGGIVVRTGTAEGSVFVEVRVQDEEPTDEPTLYEEVVDLSFLSEEGFASVIGADGAPAEGLRHVTPPRACDYRVRVEAWGRDAADAGGRTWQYESYTLTLWPADPAPPVAHRRTDRLGHRLRGEPESTWPERPELAYAWIRDSELSEAATVTIVTGSDAVSVLRAFGADPDRPTPREALAEAFPPDPWVSVLDLGDAVLAVELNGWQGSHADVLSAASAAGRAASMYWNVNAVTRLSFAERGQVLDAFEIGHQPQDLPEIAAALTGLDFDHGDWILPSLLAVERFTGHRFTRQHLEQIQTADQAYLIAPPES